MCTLVAKKFPNIGWVGVKNRDRSFSTDTELLRDQISDLQRVTLMDLRTRWSEGMNSAGISIMASSLTPIVHHTDQDQDSADAQWFRDALAESNLERAVRVLEGHVSGCVFVFDPDRLWLIEGYHRGRDYVSREVKTDHVVRTNHGIWLPRAGYQPHSKNPQLAMRRISSLARLDIAEYIADTATEPEEIMPLMAKSWTDNPQITTLRRETNLIPTRTTEQLMLEPGKKLMLVRNTDGVLEFSQADANPLGSKVLVGIV